MALKDWIARLEKVAEPRAFRNVSCCEKHLDRSLADPHSPILFFPAACPDRRWERGDVGPDSLTLGVTGNQRPR